MPQSRFGGTPVPESKYGGTPVESKYGGTPVSGSKYGGTPVEDNGLSGFDILHAAHGIGKNLVLDRAKDLGVSFASGSNALLKLTGDLYGLGTGDMDNWASNQGERGTEYWNDRKSAYLVGLEDDRKAKIDAIPDDAMFSQTRKASRAVWETLNSPALLSSFMFEQAPMLFPSMGAGRAVGAGLTKTLGTKLTEKTIQRSATAAAVGTGGALQGSDAGSQAYDQLMGLGDQVWEENDKYKSMISDGLSPEEAKHSVALGLSRDTAIASGIVSIGLNYMLPAGRLLEKRLAGEALPDGTMISNMTRGFLGETAQEGGEEGFGALFANIATQFVDPEKDIMEGVGEATGMGMAAGPFGAIAGATATPDVSVDDDVAADADRIMEAMNGAESIDEIVDVAMGSNKWTEEPVDELTGLSDTEVDDILEPEPRAGHVVRDDDDIAALNDAAAEVAAIPIGEDALRDVVSEMDEAAHQAASSPTNDLIEPTAGQIDADNYQKGHPDPALVHGLQLSIENPKGSVRKSKDPDPANYWETEMAHHYGDIKGTVGADGDNIDVFVGESLESEQVFVIDQVNQEEQDFDEHKVMLGFENEFDAVEAYKENYEDGWVVGEVNEMPVASFKDWLANGDTTVAFSESNDFDLDAEVTAEEDAEIDTDVSENPRIAMGFKDVTKRIPELTEAANQLQNEEITREEYAALVQEHKPVTPYEEVPVPNTQEEVVAAISKDKQDRVGLPNANLEAGHEVGIRLDIPAYSRHGVWAISVHEKAGGFKAGKSIGYESVAILENPTFGSHEPASLKIAAGKAKAPIAVIKGNWVSVTPEQAQARAEEALSDPEWEQVGYDPERHAYFYDRSTMEPIVGGDEVIQVGPLSLVKNPVYESADEFLFSQDKIIDLGAAREKKGLNEFYGDMMGKIATRAKNMKAEVDLAKELGVFDGLQAGDRFRYKSGRIGIIRGFSFHKMPKAGTLERMEARGTPVPRPYKLANEEGDQLYTPMLYVDQLGSNGEVEESSTAYFTILREQGYEKFSGPQSSSDSDPLFSQEIARDEAGGIINDPLIGAPLTRNIPNIGPVEFRPSEKAKDVAKAYAKESGMDYEEITEYAPLSEERATLIGDEFERMAHDPNNPEVKAAYAAMIEETIAQFEMIMKVHPELEIEFIHGEDPYQNSPSEAIIDVNENNHLWVYSTRDGFGSNEEFDPIDNPLLGETGIEIDGVELLANDVFRIVHDYFGHLKNGVGFRAEGEENAWQAHAAMYSPLARRAMTTETRGQNSWLNYGPHGEHNRTAKTEDTIFADQKIGLLPVWASREGYVNEQEQADDSGIGSDGSLLRPPVEDGRIWLSHFSKKKDLTRTDPEWYGSNFAGAERERTVHKDWINRTYFGIEPEVSGGYVREAGVGRNEYEASIDANALYDLRADPDGLLKGRNITTVEKSIRDSLYSGYWVQHPQHGMVAVMFDPLNVQPAEDVSHGTSENSLSEEISRLAASIDQIKEAVSPTPEAPQTLSKQQLENRDKKTDDETLFSQQKPVKKDGMFSAVEKEVLGMNLPQWKKKIEDSSGWQLVAGKDDVYGPIHATKKIAEDYAESIGADTDYKITEIKGAKTAPANANEIWAKLRKAPVKQEEIKWLGLEEFLTADPKAKFTREEVVNFIQANGVQVKVINADQEYKGSSQQDIEWDEGTVWESDAAWDWRVKDAMEDYDDGDTETHLDESSFVWDWANNHPREIAEEFKSELTDEYYYQLHHESLMEDTSVQHILGLTSGFSTRDARHRILPLARDDFEGYAREVLQREYFEDPQIYYSAELDEGTDLYIFGNSEIGYDVREGDWAASDQSILVGAYEMYETIYSLSEAQVQARNWAREEGHLEPEEEPDFAEIAKWGSGSYVWNGGENYREIKLALPEIGGVANAKFVEDMHFDDENLVAWLRVDDQDFFSEPHAELTKEESRPPLTPRLEEQSRRHQETYNYAGLGEIEKSEREFLEDAFKAAGKEIKFNRINDYTSYELLYDELGIERVNPVRDYRLSKKRSFESLDRNLNEHYSSQRIKESANPRKKTYFIQEFQSDWHQQGRQTGYANGDTENLADDAREESEVLSLKTDSIFNAHNPFGITSEDGIVSIEAKMDKDGVVDRDVYGDLFSDGQYLDIQSAINASEEFGKVEDKHRSWWKTGYDIIKANDMLGYDTASSAMGEIQRSDDWQQRFDLSHLTDQEVSAINSYKASVKTQSEALDKSVRATAVSRNILNSKLPLGSFTPHDFSRKVINLQEADRHLMSGEFSEDELDTLYEYRAAHENLAKLEESMNEGVPDAPFKGDAWMALGLKRAITDAVNSGYEAIAYADAEVLVDRWSDQYRTLYETQYDKKMPSILKKLTKIKPQHLDSDGNTIGPDTDVLGQITGRVIKKEGFWIVPITEELKAQVKGEGFPLFSNLRTAPEGQTGMDVASVEKAISKAVTKLKSQASVKVVEGITDLPKSIQRRIDPKARVKGVYHNGTIYLVAGNIQNETDAQVQLAHELIGHKGVLEMVSADEWSDIKNTISTLIENADPTMTDLVNEVRTRYGELDAEKQFKEILAVAAEKRQVRGPVANLIGRIREMIRRFLTSMGFTSPMMNTEIDVILSNSESYLREDDTEIGYALNSSTVEPVFSEDRPESTTPAYTDKEKAVIKKGGFGIRSIPQAYAERYRELRENIATKLRQGVVDQYASFREILKDDRAWMMSHLTKSSTGAVEAMIEHGELYMDDGAIAVDTSKKSLKEILEPLGENVDRWTYWIAGHRAEKLKAEGKENLFNQKDIKQLKGMNKGNEELFESVRLEFEALADSVSRVAVETGLLSKKEVDEWLEEGFYLPFYRVMNESDNSQGPRISNTGLARQSAYKKLKGGKQQLDDLLGNAMMNWSHLLSASLNNQAARQAIETAIELGIAKRVRKTHHSKKAIYVRDGGKEVWYEFDETSDGQLVLESLMSLNWNGLQGSLMKAARSFKRVFTIGVTINPEFKLRNLMRDTIQAIAVADMSVNITKNLYEGWGATADDSEIKAQLLAGGGIFGDSGYIHGADPEAVKHVIRKGVSRDTILDSRANIKKVFDSYQDFGARLENINRAANFTQAQDKGKDRLLSNFEARDHLDFTRTGAWPAVRAITQSVPFINARMQGLDKLARSGMDEKQRFQFAAVVTSYAMASIALYLLMKDDDDYKDAEEWERDSYHLFKLPFSDDVMYRLPRPFEVGAIASLAERVVEQMVDDDVNGKIFAERLLHTITQTFAINPIPQALMPALEVAMDKSVFTGNSIEGMALRNLSPEKRKRAWTSESASAVSQGMATITQGKVVLSPVQIEHLVGGYLGWMGSTILAAVDMLVTRPITDSPDPPALKLTEYPIIKAFAKSGPARSTKFTSLFYDRLEILNRAFADINQAARLNDLQEYQRLVSKNKGLLAYREFYNEQRTNLTNINAQMNLVRLSSRSPAEKRVEMDRLTVMRNNLTRLVDQYTKDGFD